MSSLDIQRLLIDWGEMGELVCQILTSIRANRKQIEAEAHRRGITLEQLTAAAIVEAIRERVAGQGLRIKKLLQNKGLRRHNLEKLAC